MIKSQIALRVVARNPPNGVAFAMQIGRDALQPPTHATRSALTFETRANVAPSPTGTPRFGGPPIHGPTGGRFLYINSGKRAGQAETFWDRRAKIMLTTIAWDLLHACEANGATLETEINGLAKDGGPCCATVPLIGGWRLG